MAIKILRAEFKIAMALAGWVNTSPHSMFSPPLRPQGTFVPSLTKDYRCRTIKDITRGHLAYLNSDGILAKL